jgi:hypothetical protein
MKTFSRVATILTAATLLSSCAFVERINHKPKELNSLDKAPKFDVKNFFNGDIEVFAITQDEKGKIIGTFTAKMNGKWDDSKGVLQQNYISESGKKDTRTWLITVDNDESFTAVGHDVVTPIKGKQVGNSMQMIYTLSVKIDGGAKQNVDHEDVIYMVDERSAMGIAMIRKNGSPAGKSIISYKKLSKTE